jgi:hypothetical protein
VVQVGNTAKNFVVNSTTNALVWTGNVVQTATDRVLDGLVATGSSIQQFEQRLEDNNVKSLAVIIAADGWKETARATVGLVTSNISGDAWDIQPPMELDPKRPTIFINGVGTKDRYAEKVVTAIRQREGISSASRIENNTHFVIGDFLQILGHELGAYDITAIRTRDGIRESIQKFGIANVEAHSQGTAISKAAFSMLTPAERSRVVYEGNGSQTYVAGQRFGLKGSTNIRYPKDPVPMTNDVLKWVGLRPWKQDWVVLDRQSANEDWLGHNYLVHYLNGKKQEGSR